MPSVTFIMTIEGLQSHPIEIEISDFSFGSTIAPSSNSAPPTLGVMSKDFTIQKVSDRWSPFMQQVSQTDKQIQVSITVDEDVTGHPVKRLIYSFSNALIRRIQYSGTAANGMMETVQFDSEGIDVEQGSTPFQSGKNPARLLHEMVHAVKWSTR